MCAWQTETGWQGSSDNGELSGGSTGCPHFILPPTASALAASAALAGAPVGDLKSASSSQSLKRARVGPGCGTYGKTYGKQPGSFVLSLNVFESLSEHARRREKTDAVKCDGKTAFVKNRQKIDTVFVKRCLLTVPDRRVILISRKRFSE